jgi:hypothetical protein
MSDYEENYIDDEGNDDDNEYPELEFVTIDKLNDNDKDRYSYDDFELMDNVTDELLVWLQIATVGDTLEYLREDLRSKKLTIEYKDYDCKIIKSL